MSISHRSNRLKLVGNPSVEKLQNGRFRLTFNLNPLNPRNDWYNANKDRIFADYGTLQSAEMNIDGIAPRTGEAYPDMALVSAESAQSGDTYVVRFVYETLGSSFVQTKDDTISYTQNGLRQVTRESIAAAGTDFQKTVGSTSISSQIDNEAAVTCYLARYEVDDTDSYRKVTEVYIEAGTLSVSKRNLSEGVVQVVTTFLHTEGSTVGPVTARSTGEFEGLQTISVTTLQDSDGNSIVSGGANTVHQYNRMVDFTYPGIVSLKQDKIDDDGTVTKLFNFELDPPVQAKIEGKISVIFQTSADIVAADFTFDDGGGAASGFWNPTEWASTYTSGIGHSYSPFSETQGLRGYRINTTLSGVEDVDAAGTLDWTSGGVGVFTSKGAGYVNGSNNTTSGSLFARIVGVSDAAGLRVVANGRRLFASTPFDLKIFGGPDDPVGEKYTLDVDLRPAFTDINGNTYYKKTIITATIPAK